MDVGLSVSQGVANGATPFQPASKNIVAAMMGRERGPIGVAVKSTSLQEDRAVWGNVTAGLFGALVLRNLYKNATTFGTEVWGVRVGDGNEVAASHTLLETADEVMDVTAGYKGLDSPGVWGNGISVTLFAKGPINFTLDVTFGGAVVESFAAETLAKLENVINDSSEYIHVAPGTDGYASMSTSDLTGTLTLGVDPTTLVEGSVTAELDALDGIDYNLLISTEFHTPAHASALHTRAVADEAVAVCNLAENSGLTEAATYAGVVNASGPAWVASYLSWIRTSDEDGSYRWVPSYGAMIGAGFIRKPGLNGNNVATPTGGVDANLLDCIEIKPAAISQVNVNSYVQDYLINPILAKTNYGFFAPSSRSASSNPLYHSIHVLRQTLFYVKTLRDNNLNLTQQKSTPDLKREAYVALYTFFKAEYDAGNLENEVPFDVACEIITDKTVNPAGQDRKIFNIVVNWIPTEQTESVGIRLQRNDGRLLVEAI